MRSLSLLLLLAAPHAAADPLNPLTLEPCTETNIALAAWFTKHDPDPQVRAKLQELADLISPAEHRRAP